MINENRRQILDMLAAGKISAEEAERLLMAVEGSAPPASGASGKGSGAIAGDRPRAKYIRVLVEAEDGAKGPARVNVRVPMQLLRAGVRLVSLIPPHAQAHVNEALREHGVPLNLNEIKPENIEELVDHLEDLTVDIDAKEKNAKVRVFCE
jgi:hypothetical protein